MNDEAKLLTCPFCGRKPYIDRRETLAARTGEKPGQKATWIECKTRGCAGGFVFLVNHKAAIAAWNKRAP